MDSVSTTAFWTTAQPQIHQPYFAILSSPVILGRMSTSSSPLDPDTYDGMLRTLQHRTQDIAEKASQSHVQRPQDFAADPFHGYPPPFPDAKDNPERVYFTMIDNPHPPCTLSVHSSGRGLFATRNLEAGDLVLAETAFASVWDREKTNVMAIKWDARFPKLFSEQEVGLWRVVLQQVRNNPVAGDRLLELPSDHNVLGSHGLLLGLQMRHW